LGGLRAEVNSGGLGQWFFNGARDMALDALNFVQAVGHRQLDELLRTALAHFSTPFPKSRAARQKQLLVLVLVLVLVLEQDWDDPLTRREYEIEES